MISLTAKNKFKIYSTINIFLIIISLIFLINYILLYFNIYSLLSEKYLNGILLIHMLLSPFITIIGIIIFDFYVKYKKDFKDKYKAFFIISLIFSLIPMLLIINLMSNFGT